MISASIPENESARLKALYQYDILDTEAEKVFDDLTQLASEICDTPIALISLIDPDRQWFKSRVGLDAQETERDIAFCAHAIHQKEIFEVSDTHNDVRFKNNPLVTASPNIRFYAGAPLQTPDGYAIGTLCAISDQPKTLNEHQKKALEILGREVISQLELRLKIRELNRVSQHKTDFLSNLSHELRTPLNAIISLSQLMLHDQQNVVAECHRTYLKHVDFSGKRLLDLVNSVLDLNKIESGMLELNPSNVNIKALFDSIQGMFSTIAEKKQLDIQWNISCDDIQYIFVDEARLSQIVLNIVSNAIKFSDAGHKISVNVVKQSGIFTLAVQDFGKGISEKDVALLFRKFQQVGTSSGQEGSGLGLMITKSLVELMGGKIKLNSVLGEGTLIKIDIPIGDGDKTDALQQTESLEIAFDQNASILVVEDNEINQEVVQAVLESLGCDHIDIAETGEQALQMVQQTSYALIIMDLHLPGIDGYDTSREILARQADMSIVALTADVFAATNKRVSDAGMKHILNKPIEIQKLIAILNHYCPIQSKS